MIKKLLSTEPELRFYHEPFHRLLAKRSYKIGLM